MKKCYTEMQNIWNPQDNRGWLLCLRVTISWANFEFWILNFEFLDLEAWILSFGFSTQRTNQLKWFQPIEFQTMDSSSCRNNSWQQATFLLSICMESTSGEWKPREGKSWTGESWRAFVVKITYSCGRCGDVLMCWCADMLMCWYADVLICWCADMLMGK